MHGFNMQVNTWVKRMNTPAVELGSETELKDQALCEKNDRGKAPQKTTDDSSTTTLPERQ